MMLPTGPTDTPDSTHPSDGDTTGVGDIKNVGDLSDVVRITQDLIRIDTSNYGGARSANEHLAADYIQALLEAVGLSCQRFEAAPGRTNLVARWSGSDPTLPALLLHGHLDVVPADPTTWSVDPFGGDIIDGMLWGRGAVDMKNMVGMILAAVREIAAAGQRPQRDVVLAFFADEEAGCALGSQWMVDAHPALFAGVTHAIGEGGGYSIDIGSERAYLMNTGEKGALWLRLRASGSAGHASLPNADNAIGKIAAAVARVQQVDWPVSLTRTTAELLPRLRAMSGAPEDVDLAVLASSVGASAARITAGLRNVSNVTMISGGYKENVIPESASALIDCRFLPGERDIVLARIEEAAGSDVDVEIELELIAFESRFEGSLVGVIQSTIDDHDPGAQVLPHLIPGGTDAKALSRMGITGYGFIPLRLPAGFDFPGMFHGVDERVPIASLEFGAAVLADVIRRY